MAVIDLTKLALDPPESKDREHYKIVGGKVMKRDPRTVDGIVLHQTGVEYGLTAAQVRAVGGDRHEALHRRALGQHVHMGVFDGKEAGVRCGHAVYSHPLDWYIYSADELNKRSISIEVEGKFAGTYLVEQASKWLIDGAKEGLKFLVDEGRRMGMPIKYIWAHRQSSKNRGSDPGPELWKKLVLGYAVPVLGLEIQPDLVVGDGRSIPGGWGRTPLQTGALLGIGAWAGWAAAGLSAFFC